MKFFTIYISVTGFICFSVWAGPLFGQQEELRHVEAFQSIRAGQAIHVVLQSDSSEKVRIESHGIAPRNILTENSGKYLNIRLAKGHYKEYEVKVYVSYVTLQEIIASSAAKVTSLDTLTGDRLNIKVTSAAEVSLNVLMKDISAKVSSSGNLFLTGDTEKLTLEVQSAGGVDAYGLIAEDVSVTTRSAGKAKVTANQEIFAQAFSGGIIRYRGKPQRSNTNSNSGGSVRKVK